MIDDQPLTLFAVFSFLTRANHPLRVMVCEEDFTELSAIAHFGQVERDRIWIRGKEFIRGLPSPLYIDARTYRIADESQWKV